MSDYSRTRDKTLLELSMSIQRVENNALRHMLQQQVRALKKVYEDEIHRLISDMFYMEIGHTPPLLNATDREFQAHFFGENKIGGEE